MGKKVQIEAILRALARNFDYFANEGQYSLSYDSFRHLMLAEDLVVSTTTIKAKFTQLEGQGYIYQTLEDKRSRSKAYKINVPAVKIAIRATSGVEQASEVEEVRA